MNKRRALELLIGYLKDYSCNEKFYFHKKFVEELKEIILMTFSENSEPVFLAAFLKGKVRRYPTIQNGHKL